MCWRIPKPKVSSQYDANTVTGADLVSQTTSETPESPVFGGTEDTYNSVSKKGKSGLKIKQDTTKPDYNPVNI